MPTASKKPVSFMQSFHVSREHARQRVHAYKSRRPHRSFQLTRRRDYVRPLTLPGYWAFTAEVGRTLKANRKTFLLLGLVYGLLSAFFVGLGSQSTYSMLVDTLQQTSSELFAGDFTQLGQAGLLFVSIASSGISGTLTTEQQIYAAILFLMVWLTTIWLLRYQLAGHRVKLRDGLYSAGAPLIPTFLLAVVSLLQMLPLALALLAYSAAETSGLLAGGIEAMLAWMAIILAAVLSLFWVLSTFFAMIVVTSPGTYPMRALKAAGDLVTGRRLRLLYRMVWAVLLVLVVWALILIPAILLDTWLKNMWPAIEWLPLVPIILLVLSVGSLIWSTTYVYLLYRKVLDDDAASA